MRNGIPRPGSTKAVRRAQDAPERRSERADRSSPYGAFRKLQRERSGATVGVGVLGYGYWGPNLVRNFAETAPARLVAVSDLAVDRLA